MAELYVGYLDNIRKAIDNLQQYLAVTRDEFLADGMRQHAVGYQLCLWSRWPKCLGKPFSQLHPRLDFRDTWVMNHKPNWKYVWTLREALPSLKEQLDDVIAREQEKRV